MSSLDGAWAEFVCAECDPVFEAADVGFTRQLQYAGPDRHLVSALLWEADPRRFAERYPDSGIVETYGEDEWPGVHCIDYWVYLDHDTRRARISVEGWNLPELVVQLRGDHLDAPQIADVFRRILGVSAQRV